MLPTNKEEDNGSSNASENSSYKSDGTMSLTDVINSEMFLSAFINSSNINLSLKNQDVNNPNIDRDIEAIIEKYGFTMQNDGESSVDKEKISVQTTLSTFYNPKYPNLIVHWQRKVPPFLNEFIELKIGKEIEASPSYEASSSIMKGTVLYKRFANLVENNPAFKKNGASFAENLRELSRQIFDAGTAFEAMYRKGDMLFWVLEMQIDRIINKLDQSLLGQIFSRDESSYFRERLDEIIMEIQSFEKKLQIVTRLIEDTEDRRDDTTEQVLIDGKREAARLIGSNEFLQTFFNSTNDYDYEEAKELSEQSRELLKLSNKTAKGLREISVLLVNYKYYLMGKVNSETPITNVGIERLRKLL
ncbi:15307_t:CDS:2, partial [Acaulospora colombiana]